MQVASPFAACEKQLFARLSDLGFKPECVVDVGGSNGAWSTTIVDVFPEARFEMFEPLAGRRPEYDRVLEWALRTYPNLRMHPVALGEVNGMAEFWNEKHGVGSSLLADTRPANEKIIVPVRRLDDFLAERNIPQPQVVKLDVQGAELMVMRGGRATVEKADLIHLEAWLVRGYGDSTPLLHEIIDFLRPLGHALVELGDFWRKPSQELVTVDAFFAHRRLIDRLAAAGNGFPWRENWSPEG
jgi:FkbM family methyltransferase